MIMSIEAAERLVHPKNMCYYNRVLFCEVKMQNKTNRTYGRN